ncbi:hypothetical protein HK096_009743 [Nowakowskiella sp. JEL0078]|nr:hypothetical protein HK096_009743 [Nowakowskiella sp. JEL0078]
MLLAQEAVDFSDSRFDSGYYDQYRSLPKNSASANLSESDYEEDDADYRPQSTTSPVAIKKGSRKRKPPGSDEPSALAQISDQPEAAERVNVDVKKTRQKHPVAPGMNTGAYTDEEETKFLEGLELYGREWKKLTTHIGTRDSNSIRSHAQKHFIKLFRDSKTLPLKVCESGAGYTLSGEPLDPNSAAARSYLRNWTPRTGDQMLFQESSTTETVESSVKKKPRTPSKEPKRTKVSVEKEHEDDQDEDSDFAIPVERPKRAAAQNVRYFGSQSESEFTMIPCEPFNGLPGSGASSQPFSIHVRPQAIVTMDLHAHLAQTEIIGFLAGQWIPGERRINIQGAFPCRSLEQVSLLYASFQDQKSQPDRHVHVELDPASAVEVRAEITSLGMRVVGWYHSHPVFIPDPSMIDVENQKNYQTLFKWNGEVGEQICDSIDFNKSREAANDLTGVVLNGHQNELTHEEPFVGVIVGMKLLY